MQYCVIICRKIVLIYVIKWYIGYIFGILFMQNIPPMRVYDEYSIFNSWYFMLVYWDFKWVCWDFKWVCWDFMLCIFRFHVVYNKGLLHILSKKNAFYTKIPPRTYVCIEFFQNSFFIEQDKKVYSGTFSVPSP